MKIYIDIDGVLLKKDRSLPEYGPQFIKYLIGNHDCYWLTTHCRGGKNNAKNYLAEFYPESIISKMDQIKTTDWTTLKTEGIDFNSDFLWLEDYPLEAEKKVLEAHEKKNSLVMVDLNREKELRTVRQRIEQITTR